MAERKRSKLIGKESIAATPQLLRTELNGNKGEKYTQEEALQRHLRNGNAVKKIYNRPSYVALLPKVHIKGGDKWYFLPIRRQQRRAALPDRAVSPQNPENEEKPSSGTRSGRNGGCYNSPKRSYTKRKKGEIFCPSQVTPVLVRKPSEENLKETLKNFGENGENFDRKYTFTYFLEEIGTSIVQNFLNDIVEEE